MKEKLIIKNFGPIKDVELELSKFNVLIGEQATGKSTIAKLLNFCKYFSNIQGGYFDEATQENKNHGIDDIRENLRKWGLLESVNRDCFVQFECKYYKFSFSNLLEDVGIYDSNAKVFSKGREYHLSSKIEPLTNEFRKLLDDYFHYESTGVLTFTFFENFVSEIMDYPFFVPTERGLQSIFSMGKDFTSNLSDPLFRYFVEMDKIQRLFKNETEISPLKIYYRNVDGRNEIRKKSEQSFFNLNVAASGYQSTIPIVLLLKYYNEIRNKKNKPFIIEEPELNLFPEAQKELVNYLVENSAAFGHTMLLTTHSPYILTSLNNLMYAYEVGQGKPDEVNEIIDKKYWINPEDVSAYRLEEGKARKIISKTEDGTLIEADEIDGASSIVNKEFSNLIDIELGVSNEKD